MIEERLKKIRKYAGLSQRKFAEAIGVSYVTLQNYEKDASALTLKMTNRIMSLFNINPVWILTGCGNMIISNDEEQPNSNGSNVVILSQDADNKIEKTNKYEDIKTAILANEYLQNIEKKSKQEFHMAVGYLKGISDSLDRQPQQNTDRRKSDLPFNPPDKRKKVG